ncbi:hypothetical protein L0657_10545 [Dyadobacter sp. CY345]|uniref:hypothetical protein n=1 Tax=Dyadobacter sp. CY345 TaxID=2909335 RepID=UPI001F341B8F|nr:hypothetical protein [Dyadobacter sp. CY345]MCF2444396.1 hypothetical protein [Dyadobacter sp. CY345]
MENIYTAARYYVSGLLVMILITFCWGLGDDAYTTNYTSKVWYEMPYGALQHYFLWVLPYWWLLILIGAGIFTKIAFVFKIISKKYFKN